MTDKQNLTKRSHTFMDPGLSSVAPSGFNKEVDASHCALKMSHGC